MTISLPRVRALVVKEWLDLSRTRAAIAPGILMVTALALPFFIALGLPALTGEPMTMDGDVKRALASVGRHWPELARLDPEAAAQAFFFQQFLLLVVLIPVSGAMSLATHSVIGEKQARTLEPLLATPVTTVELLLSKLLAAVLPSLLLEAVAFALYLGAIWLFAAPGVFGALVSLRTFLVVLVLGPLAALIALQLAVVASSRASDPRTAQQIGTLVILPIVGVLIAQGTGFFWLTVPIILAAAAVLAVVWAALLLFAVAIFEREQILTKGK